MRDLKPKPEHVDVVERVLRDGMEANRQKIVDSLGLAPVRAGWDEARAVVDEFLKALRDPDGTHIVIPRRPKPEE